MEYHVSLTHSHPPTLPAWQFQLNLSSLRCLQSAEKQGRIQTTQHQCPGHSIDGTVRFLWQNVP
ncbi:hypothetical protein Pyn_26689 [Prunus yedoensis var. nudiflora]|uniref:Uncharacterized protein n=1 Tax=Prunus yedoensis var. nudiflora TaxID=2094558 RepID=A0A314YRR5_PRUYE|nr:hypothetical protein Pyn_26689 [Prunus yedoensis var. nudiflora]